MGGLLSATPEIGNVQWKTFSSSFLRLPSVPFYNTSPCEVHALLNSSVPPLAGELLLGVLVSDYPAIPG
jgi:hypothetical protein